MTEPTIFALLLGALFFGLTVATGAAIINLTGVSEPRWFWRLTNVVGLILAVVAFIFSKPMFEKSRHNAGLMSTNARTLEQYSRQ